MKDIIKILYNGKDMGNIEKTSVDDEEKLLTLGMHQEIESALMPFIPEIAEEGGQVTVNVKGPNMFEIATNDLSADLKKRIVAALTPAR